MATILIAALIIAVLVAGWFVLNGVARRNVAARHGSLEDAMSDETGAGDTPEAHDEINPHDIPPGHPGRRAAEEQAETDGDGARTTRGDDDLAQARPARDERLERSSEQPR